MSVTNIGLVWKFKEISSRAELLLLLAIADYSNEDTGEAWPSVESLAKKSRSSQRSVQRMLQSLSQRGYLRIAYNAGPNGTNLYWLLRGGDTMAPPSELVTPATGVQPVAPEPSGTVKAVQEVPKAISVQEVQAVPPDITVHSRERQNEPEVIAWNAHPELPKIKCLSPGRLKHLRQRRADPFWAANFDAALAKVLASDFLMGTNDRGWKADFDWLLRPDSIAKIMEGKYDNRKPEKMTPENFWPSYT